MIPKNRLQTYPMSWGQCVEDAKRDYSFSLAMDRILREGGFKGREKKSVEKIMQNAVGILMDARVPVWLWEQVECEGR